MTHEDRHRRAMELFDLVCDLPAPERDVALRERCGDDDTLRRNVEALLQHDGVDDPLIGALESGRAVDAFNTDLVTDDDVPASIAGYRVIRTIGRGGMGVIYEAEQRSPQRAVAIKVLRAPLVGGAILKRFQLEAHVLGQLQHPGIAQIYEAGVTDEARGHAPFLAMELVDGLPITDHAEQAKLDMRERLELMARVCDAVQHAHQKGIIHRDLKPSNVLVVRGDSDATATTEGSRLTRVDAIGQPKVLDFGIARLTDAEAKPVTIETEAGQLIGTLAYMSPEQVAGSDDLDTRCDVYALGVLLYELLAGARPLRVTGAALAEAARVIQEVEPTRLGAHDRRFRGDVETVVARAMEKDRERRYGSAAELALDIRRLLHDEPIEARPASAIYRFGKFTRRNKGLVGGATVALVVLVLGAIGTTAGWFAALRSNAELDDANRALTRSNADLEQVAAFQSEQLSTLSAEVMGARLRGRLVAALPEDARPSIEAGIRGVNFTDLALDALEHNVFDRAVTTINTQFADQPELRAELLVSVGTTLSDIGLLDAAGDPIDTALELRETTLGADHADTTAARRAKGELAQRTGDLETAQALFDAVLASRTATLGERHPDTISAMTDSSLMHRLTGRYEDAERLSQEALELARTELVQDHPVALDALATAASVLLARSRPEAEPLLRESYERHLAVKGEAHQSTLVAQEDLALFAAEMGRLEEAQTLVERSLEIRHRAFGSEHPGTQSAVVLLARVLDARGRYRDALDLYRSSLAQRQATLGDEHPRTLNAANNVATTLETLGQYEEAEALHRSTLEIRRRVQGDDHLYTLISINNLAFVLVAQGRNEDAAAAYGEMMDGMRRTMGDDDPNTFQAVQNYAVHLARMGRLDEARPLYEEALEGRTRALGDEHPSTLNSIYHMGDLLRRLGALDEAEPYAVRALEAHRRILGDDHRGTVDALGSLGALRIAQERMTEAEPLIREQLERRRALLGAEHPDTLDSARALADVLDALGREEDAAALRGELPTDGS